MVHCVGLYCKNNSSRLGGKSITFHKFPTDDHLRTAWINFVSRLDWFPTESSRLCSTHFKDEDFVENKLNRLLRKGSIPTIHATRQTKRHNSRKVPYACRVPNPSELENLNREIALGVPFDEDNHANNETLAKLADSSANVPIDVVLDSAGKLHLVPTGLPLNCPPNIESQIPTQVNHGSVTSSLDKLPSTSTVIPTPPLISSTAIQKNLEQKLKLAEKRCNKERLKVVDLRKRLKHYQQCTRRLKVKLEKKNEVMNEIVQDAKSVMHEKNTMLDRVGFSKYIVQRQLEQLERNENSKRGYDEELRNFCLELVEISPRAFIYIKEKFDNCLPDIKTVQRWKRVMKASTNENDLECLEQNDLMEESDTEVLLNYSSSNLTEVDDTMSHITESILDPASLETDTNDLNKNKKVLVSDSKRINLYISKDKGVKTNKKSNLFKFKNQRRNQNSKSSSFKKLLQKSKSKKPKNKSSGIVVESGSIVKDEKDGKYRIEITNDNVMEIYEIVQVPEGNEIDPEQLFNDSETEENTDIKIDMLDHSYIHSG